MPKSSLIIVTLKSRKKALKLQKRIAAMKAKLDAMVGDVIIPGGVKVDGRKGKRCAATRGKMRAAAKATWAKAKG